jgi:type VI protein secretion system component VasK
MKPTLVNIINRNTGGAVFAGPWAVMRLLNESAQVGGNTPYLSVFSAAIKTPAHARPVVLNTRVEVSTATHPFCINVFRGFTVPERLLQ